MVTMEDIVLRQQIELHPILKPYESVMRAFFDKYMSKADPILSSSASPTRVSAARTGQVIEHVREMPRNRRLDQVRDQDRIRPPLRPVPW
jgi:hypothetical protein